MVPLCPCLCGPIMLHFVVPAMLHCWRKLAPPRIPSVRARRPVVSHLPKVAVCAHKRVRLPYGNK